MEEITKTPERVLPKEREGGEQVIHKFKVAVIRTAGVTRERLNQAVQTICKHCLSVLTKKGAIQKQDKTEFYVLAADHPAQFNRYDMENLVFFAFIYPDYLYIPSGIGVVLADVPAAKERIEGTEWTWIIKEPVRKDEMQGYI